MQARPDYDEANPDEVEPYGMDFKPDLGDGELITAAIVTLTAVQGCDPNPQSHVLGDAGITNAGTMVSQVISKLTGNVKYCILFTVDTTFGSTLELYSHVWCQIPT